MSRFFAISITGLAFIMASCATPYGGMGWRGGQQSDWINESTLKVVSSGNGSVSEYQAMDMLLLWSAEKGAEAGYKYFQIEDVDGTVKVTNTNAQQARQGIGAKGHPLINATVKMYKEAAEINKSKKVFEIDQVIAEFGPKYKKSEKSS